MLPLYKVNGSSFEALSNIPQENRLVGVHYSFCPAVKFFPFPRPARRPGSGGNKRSPPKAGSH